MDELSTIQQLLAEPPPEPDVVEAARLRLERAALGGTPLRTRAAAGGWQAPGPVRRATAPRRWPGWLAPVAAAAAVAGVILASLAISGLLRPTGTGTANSAGAFAKVPRYFVAVPEIPGRAVVGATTTGAVLGTVAPPKHTIFIWAAAAGDSRTFVLAAGVPPAAGTNVLNPRPVRFYRLILDRSGHPGRLVPLPIPAETVTITDLALSPDGSKLAVSLLPVHGQKGSKIQVFSLTTGARREWMWPGDGTIGEISLGPGSSGSNSWEANNRTLLFEVTARTRTGNQLRLLDTAAPAGSLLASSTRIPVPATEVGWQHNNAGHRIIGIPLITGDGTKLVAPFFHASAPPKVFDFTITEFSVRTGKPVQVLYRRQTDTEAASTGVWWVNTSGTAMIVDRGSVFGVQTPTTFTPLPLSTQRLFAHHGTLSRVPAW
jgi:hypothetical protein